MHLFALVRHLQHTHKRLNNFSNRTPTTTAAEMSIHLRGKKNSGSAVGTCSRGDASASGELYGFSGISLRELIRRPSVFICQTEESRRNRRA